MFNETAYKYYEWTDLNNKRYNNGRPGGYEVVGVVKDCNFSSLHDPIEPLCLIFVSYPPTQVEFASGKTMVPPSQINLTLAKNGVGRAMAHIQKVWKEIIPFYPLKYRFYDEWFDAKYKKEEKFGELIGLFSMLAIVISCMGILGLAVFSSERRAKEIGIRKVHGASIPNLMIMLNSDFVKWVAIAFVIAAPAGYYIMNNWLEDFAFKTEIDWTVFFLSGFFALSIALFTINWQIWRTTTRNPVEVLKYE
jgi:putative ABC transport system permease protein